MLDDFECKLDKVESVEDWISNGTEEDCRSCLLPALTDFYVGALEGAGETEKAVELKQVYETGDILTIVQKMDNIRGSVGEATRNSLRNLDCFAQSFKQD